MQQGQTESTKLKENFRQLSVRRKMPAKRRESGETMNR